MKLDLQPQDFATIIRSNGFVDGLQVPVQDALNTADGPNILSKVYTELSLDTIQARSLVPFLVQTMNHEGIIGESTSYRWFGAGNVPNVDRGEGGEYPEFTPQAGKASLVRAQFLQRGLVVRVTPEDIKYNRWDMISHTVTHAALALERAKEEMVLDTFNQLGVIVFDNTDPTGINSIKGKATGHDRNGNSNGSFSYDDYVEMFNVQAANGYSPNVVLIHPFALPIFQKDPMLRHMGFKTGNPVAYFNQNAITTNAYNNGTIDTWRKQQRKASGNSLVLDEVTQAALSTQTPDLPAFHPLNGMNIIVTDRVPYDPVAKVTSIIMVDTSAGAVLNVQEKLTTETYVDDHKRLQYIRIREAYSVDILDEGRGVAVALNIPIVPNELFVDPIVTLNAKDIG